METKMTIHLECWNGDVMYVNANGSLELNCTRIDNDCTEAQYNALLEHEARLGTLGYMILEDEYGKQVRREYVPDYASKEAAQ